MNVSLKDRIALLEIDNEAHEKAAGRMAAVLQDLYNNLGEFPEVSKAYHKVEKDVDWYKCYADN